MYKRTIPGIIFSKSVEMTLLLRYNKTQGVICLEKKKLNLGSFGAGITAGGIILLAGIIPSLFKGEEGSFSSLLIALGVICLGLAIHKYLGKKKDV